MAAQPNPASVSHDQSSLREHNQQLLEQIESLEKMLVAQVSRTSYSKPSSPGSSPETSDGEEQHKDRLDGEAALTNASKSGVPFPPIITLSSSKVFKFKPFHMYITLHPEWAKRYTEDEIMRAGLSAKARKEEAPTIDLPPCHCSAGKRIVEIGISSREVFGPNRTSAGFIRYTFDVCRTNCSSSRSRVVLVVDELPDTQPISSPPFVIYAREKQKKKGPAVADPNVTRNRVSPGAPQQPPTDQAWWQLMEYAGHKLTPDRPTSNESKVVIRLFSTTCTCLEVEELVQHFIPHMKRLPGFIDFKCKTFPGFFVSFAHFDTAENANASGTVVAKYMNNEEGYTNSYHGNLSEIGVAVLLAVCTSY